jgi:hypothetical protein
MEYAKESKPRKTVILYCLPLVAWNCLSHHSVISVHSIWIIKQQNFSTVVYPGIFLRGGSTNSVEDRRQREQGSGGGSPLVRGSGGSCNLVQEISFHIVIFS